MRHWVWDVRYQVNKLSYIWSRAKKFAGNVCLGIVGRLMVFKAKRGDGITWENIGNKGK